MGEGKNWPIVCAAFVTQALTHGFCGCMGIFYVEWKKSFGDEVGSSVIGWLTSSVLGVLLSTATISGALSHHFGVRPVVMLGGSLSALGLFISSFADTVHLLLFTVPLTGFGCGLAYASSVTIITQYFHKHFALASGLTGTGIAVGVMTSPIIVRALVNYYTWRNAIMVVAGIIAQVIVCGALMKPSPNFNEETKVNPARKSSVNFDQELSGYKISRDVDCDVDAAVVRSEAPGNQSHAINLSVILDSIGISLIWTNRVYACTLPMFYLQGGGSYILALVYIKEKAEVVGISDLNATLLLCTIGISGLIARVGHGRLVDKKIFHPTTLAVFSNSLAATALPIILATENYTVYVLCAASIGFSAGLYIPMNIVMVRSIAGLHRFPGGMGLALLMIASGQMSTVALAGWLLDYTGDYIAGFLYASLLQGLSGIWALVSHIVWTKCIKDPRWPPSISPS